MGTIKPHKPFLFSPLIASTTHLSNHIETKNKHYKNSHNLYFICKYTTLFDIIKLYLIFLAISKQASQL